MRQNATSWFACFEGEGVVYCLSVWRVPSGRWVVRAWIVARYATRLLPLDTKMCREEALLPTVWHQLHLLLSRRRLLRASCNLGAAA